MITLASDFGCPYPAAMKGVILQRSDARLVDVSHELPRNDPHAGAFWLRETLPHFPPAVHLAVVDPGVGTDRAALVVRAGDHALVGPDNGLLFPAARRILGREATTDDLDVFEIEVENPASRTFHGRDVFAPAAAEVHEVGVGRLDDADFLTPTDDFVDLEFPEADVSEGPVVVMHDYPEAVAEGEVLVVDDFGNVITNIPGDVLAGVDGVDVNGERVPVGRTFASVPAGEKVVTVGSHGLVECDVNQGRGDEAFDLRVGDPVRLEFGSVAEAEVE